MMTQVGQDQVDAGFVMAGEQHPAVDDEQTPEMLGKPSALRPIFTNTAQGGHPQRTRRQRAWRLKVGRCLINPGAARPATSPEALPPPACRRPAGRVVRGGWHLRKPRVADLEALQTQSSWTWSPRPGGTGHR